MNATEISKELDNVYKDSAASYRTVNKWAAEFRDPERRFEDAPIMDHPSTITADENIEAVERIVMRDRQISIRRVAYELAIPKTTIYERDEDISYLVSRTPGTALRSSELIFPLKNVYREYVTHVGQDIVIKKIQGNRNKMVDNM